MHYLPISELNIEHTGPGRISEEAKIRGAVKVLRDRNDKFEHAVVLEHKPAVDKHGKKVLDEKGRECIDAYDHRSKVQAILQTVGKAVAFLNQTDQVCIRLAD